jgi:hypothetical protein
MAHRFYGLMVAVPIVAAAWLVNPGPAHAWCTSNGGSLPAGTTMGSGWTLAPCPSGVRAPSGGAGLGSAASGLGAAASGLGSAASGLNGAAAGLGVAAAGLGLLGTLMDMHPQQQENDGPPLIPENVARLQPVPDSDASDAVPFDIPQPTISPEVAEALQQKRCQAMEDAKNPLAVSCWGGLDASTRNAATMKLAETHIAKIEAQPIAHVTAACAYGTTSPGALGPAGINCVSDKMSQQQCESAKVQGTWIAVGAGSRPRCVYLSNNRAGAGKVPWVGRNDPSSKRARRLRAVLAYYADLKEGAEPVDVDRLLNGSLEMLSALDATPSPDDIARFKEAFLNGIAALDNFLAQFPGGQGSSGGTGDVIFKTVNDYYSPQT